MAEANRAKKDTPAEDAPSISLAKLLDGKVDSFRIDMGDLFSLDEDLSPEEQEEVGKRQEQLQSGLQDMARELFAKAAETAREVRTAQQAMAQRLAGKKRRTEEGEAVGGAAGAPTEPAANGAPSAGAASSAGGGAAAPAAGGPADSGAGLLERVRAGAAAQRKAAQPTPPAIA